MKIFLGGNGKLPTLLQNFNRPETRRRRHDLAAVRDDVRHRPSRPGGLVEAAEFSSRAAAVIASWCLAGGGPHAKSEAHDRDLRCFLLWCPPGDSLASVLCAISFQLCTQVAPDEALHMTLNIVSLGSPDAPRHSSTAGTGHEEDNTHFRRQRCAHFPPL
ncbi:hypothetical protein SVAN01_02936 [Stagonosporopsis vannaccii]|nr:hypothetical protein SVAN01_02936 [Stagonosporopsis vannaccii]